MIWRPHTHHNDLNAMHPTDSKDIYVIATFYQFKDVAHVETWQHHIQTVCTEQHIFGTILLSKEGINGTIAGTSDNINFVMSWLKQKTPFSEAECKFSSHHHLPFHRLKIRIKKEIVTMGREDVRPSHKTGIYVEAKEWNKLISDPDVLLIDTRNTYEIAIGQFQGAVNPKTQSFRQFPAWAETLAKANSSKEKPKIAMYCTGGIRCEKSTALMQSLGFETVYHLKGGILQYLEDVPETDSLWAGECFVFDNRVAVDHQLKKGHYEMCYACKMPLSPDDTQNMHYQPGISCRHCYDMTTKTQRDKFAERARQMKLAKQRQTTHLGSRASPPRKLTNK